MASSLLALLDDISTLLDDVATLSKVAAKKTSGVVGDDLALNAEQVSGFKADRELPVVWAVAKGSLLNKVILVPAALLISAFVPVLLVPLLMIGGLFLCFEGFEKVAHKLTHEEPTAQERREQRVAALANPKIDLVALEKDRIKGAIRTDFILSAEIIVIALSTMTDSPMSSQIAALSFVAVAVTVVVYGLVAGIVKLDNWGLSLHRTPEDETGASARRALGAAILAAAPWLMKTLSIVGTAAMFLVGGSILVHGIPPVEHLIENLAHGAAEQAAWLGTVVTLLGEALVGIVAGGIVVGVVSLVKRYTGSPEPEPS
jgi:predicted DNA repair protein MutK